MDGLDTSAIEARRRTESFIYKCKAFPIQEYYYIMLMFTAEGQFVIIKKIAAPFIFFLGEGINLPKIMVIDDEKNIRELIKFNLENAGYEVALVSDGQVGLESLDQTFDLIVLDLMLPGIDGLTFCRKVRGNNDTGNIPIIMLTAKSEEVDRIIGLEMGADDYLTKPFSPRELLARIKAILRRVNSLEVERTGNEITSPIKRGQLEFDIQSYEVTINEEMLELTPKEFDLLKLLLLNEGKVMTRDLLLQKIWGYEYAGDTRTVDVHIRRLRQKIGDDYIITVRGVGYKFAKLE